MLSRAAVVLISIALVTAACGGSDREDVMFTHGVASGDVRPDAALLWTRVDGEATLSVQVATDTAFADVVAEEAADATAERDFTAKADVGGLAPATQYYYRFLDGESVSDTGAFRTAPEESSTAPVRFIFSGDADATVQADGSRVFDFRVLDAARAEDADFFLFFGDTVHADSGEAATTLEEYRAKHKESRDIERIRDIFAATSIYTTWDDHEVTNDFAGTTVDPDLFANGLQAYREYLPLSGDDTPERLYRRYRWGSAIELIILDGRSFRDADVEAACTPEGAEDGDLLPSLGEPGVPESLRGFRSLIGLPAETDAGCIAALNDPARTMLGAEQKQFLLDALADSDATFKFVVNNVPMAQFVATPYDRWEGYRAERDEILRFVAENEIENVVFLTTSYHASIISNVWIDAIADRETSPVALEAVTGPIASQTVGTFLVESFGDGGAAALEAVITVVAGAECVELDAFSYGLVEVDAGAGTASITLKDEDGATLCERLIEAA